MGILYLVATPIGNLEDITIRGIKTLFTVDYIACEDTRRTGQLLKIYDSRFKSRRLRDPAEAGNHDLVFKNFKITKYPKLISFYDEVEEIKTPEIIELLSQDKSVALVSDSGTPLIADPGFKLVRECYKHNMPVISIPGPTAVISALISSGFASNQFLFLGYPPNTQFARVKFFQDLKKTVDVSSGIKPTIIFYESPHRFFKAVEDLKQVFGDITIAVLRELTKVHEEIFRGKISTALKHFKKLKGEITIVFNLYYPYPPLPTPGVYRTV